MLGITLDHFSTLFIDTESCSLTQSSRIWPVYSTCSVVPLLSGLKTSIDTQLSDAF